MTIRPRTNFKFTKHLSKQFLAISPNLMATKIPGIRYFAHCCHFSFILVVFDDDHLGLFMCHCGCSFTLLDFHDYSIYPLNSSEHGGCSKWEEGIHRFAICNVSDHRKMLSTFVIVIIIMHYWHSCWEHVWGGLRVWHDSFVWRERGLEIGKKTLYNSLPLYTEIMTLLVLHPSIGCSRLSRYTAKNGNNKYNWCEEGCH